MSTTSQQNRCNQGGPPVPNLVVAVPLDAPVDFRFIPCRSDALLQLFLDEHVLINGDSTQWPNGELTHRLPELSPGRHALGWTVACNGPKWQTLLEVAVDGAVERRDRKDHATMTGLYQSVVFLDVQ